MAKRVAVRYSGVFAGFVLICMLFGCSHDKYDYRTLEGVAWHTSYRIVYQGESILADSVVAIFPMVENSLSPFIPQSRISRINVCADSVADWMIAKIFNESRRINAVSGGMFDPTVSPLVNMWGFGFENYGEDAPDQVAIDSVLAFVGIDKATIDGNNVVKKPDPRMQFNFSAITKGYGCDLVAEMFCRNGVKNYMIEIGGEIVAAGVNPHGKPWRIQIDVPDDTDPAGHNRLRLLSLDDCAVATSGNYRNFRDVKGTGRVGHTISPKTGRPVATTTLSVSVTAPTCLMADALATAAMAMTADSALSMFRSINGVEGMLVIADSVAPEGIRIIYSDGFPTK